MVFCLSFLYQYSFKGAPTPPNLSFATIKSMTNVWGRRGISTLLLMQYLLIVVGHGAEGHSLGFSFKIPQVFALSVSHSAHAKSARRILFRIFITPPEFSARPQGSRKVKIKPYILHPLCKRGFAGTIFDPFL